MASQDQCAQCLQGTDKCFSCNPDAVLVQPSLTCAVVPGLFWHVIGLVSVRCAVL